MKLLAQRTTAAGRAERGAEGMNAAGLVKAAGETESRRPSGGLKRVVTGCPTLHLSCGPRGNGPHFTPCRRGVAAPGLVATRGSGHSRRANLGACQPFTIQDHPATLPTRLPALSGPHGGRLRGTPWLRGLRKARGTQTRAFPGWPYRVNIHERTCVSSSAKSLALPFHSALLHSAPFLCCWVGVGRGKYKHVG